MNEPKVIVKSAETWGKVSSSSARLPFHVTMAEVSNPTWKSELLSLVELV
jgi:hypothetical protein